MIEFVELEPAHLPMLWEWIQRPHVAKYWGYWNPPTREENIAQWTAMIEGRKVGKPYLIRVDGNDIGYIDRYRLSQDEEMWTNIGLGEDAVGADIFIADESLTGGGLGARVVARFYLWLTDQEGLEVAIIDPEVGNDRAIRAYEKAGFRFLKVTDTGEPRGRDHIMSATRADIEAALRGLDATPG
ncbi:MAG: GNAT family N-acetyltransferase [Candidatus Dormibacteria bacterium]